MSAPRHPVQAEDFLQLRIPADPQLSPDATSVAFTVKSILTDENCYRNEIYTVATNDSDAPRLLARGSSPRWSPDSRSVAYLANPDGRAEQVFLAPHEAGEPKQLTHLPPGNLRSLQWSPNGQWLALSFRAKEADFTSEASEARRIGNRSTPPRVLTRLAYREEGRGFVGTTERFHIYLVNAATGETRRVTAADRDHNAFCFAPDSSTIVCAANVSETPDLQPKAESLFLLPLEAGPEWMPIPLGECPVGPKYGLQFSPDGNMIAFRGHDDLTEGLFDARDINVMICDRHGATRNLTIDVDKHFANALTNDVLGEGDAGPHWSSDGRELFVIASKKGTLTLQGVRTDGAALPGFRQLLGSDRQCVLGLSLDRNRNTAAAVIATLKDAGDIYLFSLADGTTANSDDLPHLKRLTWLNRDLFDAREVIAPIQSDVSSSDGSGVSCWTYLPASYASLPTPCPTVVVVHGGPHLMHGGSVFGHDIQTLVGSGYCVLALDPRGSKGYGQSYSQSIVGIWDKPAIDDVHACINYAISQEWADAERIGVIGGSYGGYLTARLLTETIRFRAAIAERGLYSLSSEAGTCDVTWTNFQYFQANTTDTPEVYLQHSPLTHAAKIETPLMLMHGEGDLRCPIQQAEQMFAALRQADKPVVFVRYGPEANHGLTRIGPPDLRLDRLERIRSWFAEYLLG